MDELKKKNELLTATVLGLQNSLKKIKDDLIVNVEKIISAYNLTEKNDTN